MEPDSQHTAKQMRLRYAGSCSVCGADLPAGVKAVYDRSSKTVRCVACVTEAGATGEPVAVNVLGAAATAIAEPPPSLEQAAGLAGSSARREYERLRSRREDRIRSNHPKLGGLILALSDDPQSTRAWERGAIGEERLGARLDQLDSAAVATLSSSTSCSTTTGRDLINRADQLARDVARCEHDRDATPQSLEDFSPASAALRSSEPSKPVDRAGPWGVPLVKREPRLLTRGR